MSRCARRPRTRAASCASAGRPPAQVTRRGVFEALRRLARHSLVDIERGFAGEDGERFVVNPLVEKVLPPDRIAELAERVRSYRGAEEPGEAADVEADASGGEGAP